MSSMRESMPTVAAIVDDLRAAFGVDGINGRIREGLRGSGGFWASEGGRQIGSRSEYRGTVVSVGQMVVDVAPVVKGKKC